MRIGRMLPAALDDGLRTRLGRLREKIARNKVVLAMHLSAIQELAGLLGLKEQDATQAK